ncbi:MarR family transcriptional regulator [Frankia casuarinae]|uniref:MarR family transcriptional regulator n=1 Tax=Frankia TaxID=1854 RepID=UPI00358EDA62
MADLSGLRTGTVTGALDRLERVGHVRRERSAENRRKAILSRAGSGSPRTWARSTVPREPA